MDDKKKKFIQPEADILEFIDNNDIITLSAEDATLWWGEGDGEWW